MNSWEKIKFLGTDNKGRKKYCATIGTPDFQPVVCKTDGEKTLLYNSKIYIEVFPTYTTIWDEFNKNLICGEEIVYFDEFEFGDSWKWIKRYAFSGKDIEVTTKKTENGYSIKREIDFSGDGKFNIEYLLEGNSPLKYSCTIFNETKEKRKFIIRIKRNKFKDNRLLSEELTSYRGEQVIDDHFILPYAALMWEYHFGGNKSKVMGRKDFTEESESLFFSGEGSITENLYAEMQSEKLINTVIDRDELTNELFVETSFHIIVEPEGTNGIDPYIYSSNNPSTDGYVYANYDLYGHVVFAESNTGTVIDWGTPGAAAKTRGFAQWDITSIPDVATITSVSLKYDGRINAGVSTIIGAQRSPPTTRSASDKWYDIQSMTFYVNSATFPVVGTNQTLDLGAAAVSNVQSQLAGNWTALGFKIEDESTTHQTHIWSEDYGSANPKPTLYVEYYLFGTELGAAEYGSCEIH